MILHSATQHGNHSPFGVVVSMLGASWSIMENMQQPCGFALIYAYRDLYKHFILSQWHLWHCRPHSYLNQYHYNVAESLSDAIWQGVEYTKMNIKRVNMIRLKQYGWQFADDILKCIFLKDTSCICILFLPVSPTKNNGSLIHWGRVTHKCVGKLTIIGSDNGLSPDRRQAIIWTNAGLLLVRTNFSDFLSEIRAFSFKKMHLKMSSWIWQPSCLGLNVLIWGSWKWSKPLHKTMTQFIHAYMPHTC